MDHADAVDCPPQALPIVEPTDNDLVARGIRKARTRVLQGEHADAFARAEQALEQFLPKKPAGARDQHTRSRSATLARAERNGRRRLVLWVPPEPDLRASVRVWRVHPSGRNPRGHART